jgi:hypothetical protein
VWSYNDDVALILFFILMVVSVQVVLLLDALPFVRVSFITFAHSHLCRWAVFSLTLASIHQPPCLRHCLAPGAACATSASVWPHIGGRHPHVLASRRRILTKSSQCHRDESRAHNLQCEFAVESDRVQRCDNAGALPPQTDLQMVFPSLGNRVAVGHVRFDSRGICWKKM